MMLSFGALDYRLDTRNTVRRRPLVTDLVRIIVRNHLVIRGSYKTFCRIEKVRQLRRRNKSFPVVVAPSRDGQKAAPVALGRESDRVLTDVASIVGIHNIFRRNFPSRYRRLKLLPILGAINSQRCQVARRAGLTSNPSQSERAFA